MLPGDAAVCWCYGRATRPYLTNRTYRENAGALDLGYTTELSFRLALRAAALCSPQKLSMTRRNVFDLMRSAYGVRSAIVHGETPRPKDLKVKGAQVPLVDFVQATEEVVRQGLRASLQRETKGKWPPDWDGMTLPNTPAALVMR